MYRSDATIRLHAEQILGDDLGNNRPERRHEKRAADACDRGDEDQMPETQCSGEEKSRRRTNRDKAKQVGNDHQAPPLDSIRQHATTE
jgi:hypothetical protein